MFFGTFGAFFFVPANPTAKKSPKWPPRAPPGPSRGPARRVTSVYCSLLGAFQGRIWSQNGTPNGTQHHLKIDLGAQGAAQTASREPLGGILALFGLHFEPPGIIFELCPQTPSLPAFSVPSQLDHSRTFIWDPFFVSPWCFLSAKPSH